MSIKIIPIILLMTLTACNKSVEINEEPKRDFSKYSQVELDSLGEWYNNASNYFLQVSENHRRYKDSALIAAPNNIEYRQVYSYSYKKAGEHLKAMAILNEAVKRDSLNGSVEAMKYRAWSLLYYYRDYEGAIRDITNIEKLTGFRYNTCWGEPCGFQKGQAFYQLENYDKAIETLLIVNEEEEKLGFDTKDNFYIHFYLARAYHKNGDVQKAMEHYDTVLTFDDEFSEAVFFKGLLLKETGDKAAAKLLFEKAGQLLKEEKKMDEPYIERFDELFEWMVEKEL
jgi:tetratricopeptide (TPR) repeat protein